MTQSLFSPSWYRVAGLRPSLRIHAQIHRHHYRGELWYVLQDHSSGRYHRFTPSAYFMIGLMSGEKTLQEIWDIALEKLADNVSTQDEFIQLVGQLHASDVLVCDIPPDSLELFKRYQKRQRLKWKQRIWSPLSLRFPLYDPESFLGKWCFLVRPLFSWMAFLIWLIVVVSAFILAAIHWPDITENISDKVLTPYNLFIIWLVYPVIKLFHEFGHAFAAKVWGGEVHEMGIMLLVFMPVPYVEASSASAFRNKKKRVVVGAAGMIVEMFLAAMGLFVWLNVEQGLVHTIAYNTMLIGGVSTLLFNGNPLLRFDGYYMLADFLEIPNLSMRSNNYLGYLVKRYLFGTRKVLSPASTAGERWWLFFYGLASFCYRLFIFAVIILFVSTKFFTIGVVLALWALTTMILVPLAKNIRFVFASPVISSNRLRSITVTALIVSLLGIFLFVVPVPSRTRVQGIVWPLENSHLRAAGAGFFYRFLKAPWSDVRRGEPLIESRDPLLSARVKVIESRLREVETRYIAELRHNRTKAQVIKDQINATKAELALARKNEGDLVINSPSDGVFIVPKATDLQGRYIEQGELMGFVVKQPVRTVRVVVPQSDVGMIRNGIEKVEARLVENTRESLPLKLIRAIPAASDRLPSPAFAVDGGGTIPVKADTQGQPKTLESIFQFDFELPETSSATHLGSRVYVRIDHPDEALAKQWYRNLRQLFLRRFGV